MVDERCDFCKDKMGDFELSSRHVVCSRCFSEIAQKSQKAKPLYTKDDFIEGKKDG